MTCYRNGGCGPYEMRPCNECPASKPEYLKPKDKELIQFPTQYLDKYILGEINLTEATDKTVDEFCRLMEEYLDKNI